MSEGAPSGSILLLILLSAIIHSSWNFFTRVVKGDFSVFFLAIVFGFIIYLPVGVIWSSTQDDEQYAAVLPYTVASGTIRTAYSLLLAYCYQTSDMSSVYPMSRGSSVAMTALFAMLILREDITAVGWIGILAIAIGIVLISKKKQPSESNTDTSGAVDYIQYEHVVDEQETDMIEMKTFSSTISSSVDDEEGNLDANNGERNHDNTPARSSSLHNNHNDTSQPMTSLRTIQHWTTSLLSFQRDHRLVLKCICLGLTIATYHIVDKAASSLVNPVSYMLLGELWEIAFIGAYMLRFRLDELRNAWTTQKKYIFIIGIGRWSAYVLIVYAFRHANAGYVVALREFGVVLGTFAGVFFLKEELTWLGWLGVGVVVLGMLLVKLA